MCIRDRPIIESGSYSFTVKVGKPPAGSSTGTKLSRGANFKCLMSNSPIEPAYIKSEGVAKRMNSKLMALVAEGPSGRVYLSPDAFQEGVAAQAAPAWKPETSLPDDPRNFWTLSYGLTTFGDLFTPRQLTALNTLSDLVGEAMEKCRRDGLAAGFSNSPI